MSFILDALRKSETARRRSEAPDLFATMPSAPELMRVRPQWPVWALGIVAVLSLIAALWLFAQRAPSAAPGDAPDDIAANTSMTTPAAAQPVVVQPPATVVVTPAPAAANVVPQPSITPRTSPSAPALLPATPDITPKRDLPSPPEPLAVPPPAPPITPAAPPAGDQIVSLADLDPGSRKQLPPLKLSMHLWNETASQRFVIVDGQRLKEGDVLGEIVIERITRDGTVLMWRGSRLKIAL
jgi:general secretion pathway protein B